MLLLDGTGFGVCLMGPAQAIQLIFCGSDCRALVDEASAGLARLAVRNAAGDDESIYLRPLHEVVASGRTFAEHLLDKYETSWARSLAPLWHETAYWAE